MAGYIPRWYTRPKTVTHPGTNRARRALTSFIRRTPLTTTPRRNGSMQHAECVALCKGRQFSPFQLGSCIRYNTHTHPFSGPFSRTTQVSRYQKSKTNLDSTEARESEWQWHQLGHMQVCTSLQTDKHTSTPPLSFLQAGCPSCRPTNSVKALKVKCTEGTGKN